MNDFEILLDYGGREIRLTDERWAQIISHVEMIEQRDQVVQTLAEPDTIIAAANDPTVHVYQRFYEKTPVTSKYMLVAVKILEEDAFIVTAFFSSRAKKGDVVWQK
jgi:hypothetical protein